MGFRDDREAGLQRIEVLERERDAARNELEPARLRAAEVDDLRKRMAELTRERDGLRANVEPGWAGRRQTIRIGLVVLVIVLVGAGGFATTIVRRELEDAHVRAALAESANEQAQAELDTTRERRAAAEAELADIDAVHEDDVADLRRMLNSARMHATGPGLLVTARITSREGRIPAGVTDVCTLAIRNLHGPLCAVSVMCGATEVFPLVEPPDVTCVGWHETAGEPVSVEHAAARVDDRSPPLFEYDARERTLDVRETAPGGFTLYMRVESVLPYQFR